MPREWTDEQKSFLAVRRSRGVSLEQAGKEYAERSFLTFTAISITEMSIIMTFHHNKIRNYKKTSRWPRDTWDKVNKAPPKYRSSYIRLQEKMEQHGSVRDRYLHLHTSLHLHLHTSLHLHLNHSCHVFKRGTVDEKLFFLM